MIAYLNRVLNTLSYMRMCHISWRYAWLLAGPQRRER